jgi:hypothetical protein
MPLGVPWDDSIRVHSSTIRVDLSRSSQVPSSQDLSIPSYFDGEEGFRSSQLANSRKWEEGTSHARNRQLCLPKAHKLKILESQGGGAGSS